MLAWCMAAALGTSPDRYPLQARVDLPPEGVVRIHVPPELRTPEDPPDGTDLLLIDGEGNPVQMIRVEGAEQLEDQGPLTVIPTEDPREISVQLGELPVDSLRIVLPSGAAAATVTVHDPSGTRIVAPTLLWRLPDGSRDRIALPGLTGTLSLHLEPHGPIPRQPPRVFAERRVAPGVPPDRWSVEPGAPVLQENGWVVHELPLDRPLPLDRLRPSTPQPNVERNAAVLSLPWESSVFDRWQELSPPGTATPIRKVTFGEIAAELLDVAIPPRAERLVLLISAHDKPPLPLDQIELELDGVHLLVLDPGPGPHTLYGGAPPGTSPAWDLEAAAAELAREASAVVEVGSVEPNPTWVPPEAASGLIAPSTPLDTRGFAWWRPINGPAGPVKIEIPADLLAQSRPDLSDVRLTTETGDKIPHLVRRSAHEPALEGVTWERTEEGPSSKLQVTLPISDVPISTVLLSSPAPLFDRRIRLDIARGASLQPIRAVRWRGGERPGALAINVGQPVGDSFLITIDNGDDPPLQIDDLQVHLPGWEIVAVLPQGPVRLYHGDQDRDPPDYDLVLLADQLRRRALTEATVGAPAPVARRSLSLLDRLVLAAGMGALAIGLAALLLDLLRRAPAVAPPGVPEPNGDTGADGANRGPGDGGQDRT